MRVSRLTVFSLFVGLSAVARAVYAPVPDQQQGRDISISLEAGLQYNSNIFGAATDPISSWIYELSPNLAFNSSLSDQTFFSSHFHPTLDYFENRPGTKAVYSQAIDAHIAHSYSPTSVLDVSDSYSYDQNPEAILNGATVPINTDQTLQSNEFDAHFSFAPTEKLGLVIKARSVYYDYINTQLGDQLNRFENLYGLEFDYSLLPDLKLAGEYRHQDVDYQHDPANNNKHTDFFMAGLDYAAAPKLTASFRLGAEYRTLAGLPDQTSPYAEFSLKYDYAKGSFVSAGYTYDLEETSAPNQFSDERVNRMFVNVQHKFSALIVGSASIDYEPSTLVARPGQGPNIEEDTTHAGVALTYLPTKNWSIIASYDYDFVDSALSYRGLERTRYGLSATYVF
jgi:hypothetical protein